MCLAAHESSVTGVVSLAGVLDLKRAYELHLSKDAVSEFLGGTPSEVPDHYREADPMRLSMPQARQCVVQGTRDDIVPPDFARSYAASKKKDTGKHREDVRLLEISGAGHFDMIDPRSAAWKVIEKTVLEMIG
jgi:pimeloyl-ACP methyl ester carboxylesterase